VFTIGHGTLRLLCLKSIGVKFKVFVKDKDTGLFSGRDEDVDDFIQLLQLTPHPSNETANWTTVVMEGMRKRLKTR